jgi:hypothetical protein
MIYNRIFSCPRGSIFRRRNGYPGEGRENGRNRCISRLPGRQEREDTDYTGLEAITGRIMPSRPSSASDWSRTRKNRHAYRGEQSQSSREIPGDDTMIRSPAISPDSSRPISSTGPQSRRTHLIRTCDTMPGLRMTKSQILPGSCW